MYAQNVEQFSNKIFQSTNRFWLVPFFIFSKLRLAQPTLCPGRNRRSGHPSEEQLGFENEVNKDYFFIKNRPAYLYLYKYTDLFHFSKFTSSPITASSYFKQHANFR